MKIDLSNEFYTDLSRLLNTNIIITTHHCEASENKVLLEYRCEFVGKKFIGITFHDKVSAGNIGINIPDNFFKLEYEDRQIILRRIMYNIKRRQY